MRFLLMLAVVVGLWAVQATAREGEQAEERFDVKALNLREDAMEKRTEERRAAEVAAGIEGVALSLDAEQAQTAAVLGM